MKKIPLFTVIVTTHQRPKLLSRALLSILGQGFEDVEIVLAADEGSGETKNVGAEYLREDDIFLVLPRARGPAQTRNAGIYHATGKYLLFLDDDDTLDSDFLLNLVEREDFNNEGINYVNYTKLTENRHSGEIPAAPVTNENIHLASNNIDELMVVNFIPNNCFIYASAIAKQFDFDIHLNSHEDWDYLLSLYMRYDFNYIDIFGPVVHINNGESRNTNGVANGARLLDFLSIYRKWPTVDPQIKQKRKDILKMWGLDLPTDLM